VHKIVGGELMFWLLLFEKCDSLVSRTVFSFLRMRCHKHCDVKIC
jgi:hypothetical protein